MTAAAIQTPSGEDLLRSVSDRMIANVSETSRTILNVGSDSKKKTSHVPQICRTTDLALSKSEVLDFKGDYFFSDIAELSQEKKWS